MLTQQNSFEHQNAKKMFKWFFPSPCTDIKYIQVNTINTMM